MTVSVRMAAVQSPIIPVVGELIRTHPGTISLGQGVVNYPPPPEALEAVARFSADPANHTYKMVHGIPPLLDRIEAKLRSDNGTEVGPGRRIVVTAGSNMGFLNAVLAIADPGDEIIQLVPYYFNHEMAVTIASCRSVCVATDDRFQPRIDAIEAAITPKTRAVVSISPNNPSGVVYPPVTVRAINELCRRKGIYHINDEAYDYFLYDDAVHYSPASEPNSTDHTISLFSLSKAYGFASWRIGWMLIPDALFDSVRKIQDTNLICPPVVSQWAAVGALETGRAYCDTRIGSLAAVRSSLLERLASLGNLVTVSDANGAFYLLIRVNTELEDMELVRRLIAEHGVATIPGSTFGMREGTYLRVAYGALDPRTVSTGVDRLVAGIGTICN